MSLNLICQCFRQVQKVTEVDNKDIGIGDACVKKFQLGNGFKLQTPSKIENHTRKSYFVPFFFKSWSLSSLCASSTGIMRPISVPAYLVCVIFADWSHI